MSFDSEEARLVDRIHATAFYQVKEVFYHSKMGGGSSKKIWAMCINEYTFSVVKKFELKFFEISFSWNQLKFFESRQKIWMRLEWTLADPWIG